MANDSGFQSVTFDIKGLPTSHMLMHNGALADPLNEIVQEMKPFTGKRKKTSDDHEAIQRLEFIGGLYMNDDNPRRIVMPASNIESMIQAAARKTKRGKDVSAGLFVEGDPLLQYWDQKGNPGPTDPEKLFANKFFVDRRGVVVSKARVFRTRPRFKNWALTFTVNIDLSVFDKKDLVGIMETAAVYIGLGDFRPKFGRFSVEKVY